MSQDQHRLLLLAHNFDEIYAYKRVQQHGDKEHATKHPSDP